MHVLVLQLDMGSANRVFSLDSELHCSSRSRIHDKSNETLTLSQKTLYRDAIFSRPRQNRILKKFFLLLLVPSATAKEA